MKIKEPIKKILKNILMENYETFVQNPVNEKKKIAKEIDALNQKISTARNKLLSEIIEDQEYLKIKKDCRLRIEKLEEELNQSVEKREISNIKEIPRAEFRQNSNLLLSDLKKKHLY